MIRKIMTNGEIYNIALNLTNTFSNMADLKLPVKVHFYFQKNMNSIVEMGKDIDNSRMEIIQKYGTLDEEKQVYNFAEDKAEQANKDITDLFSLEQEVKIYTFPLEWLDGIDLTASQVSAFTFMLDDIEEEEE